MKTPRFSPTLLAGLVAFGGVGLALHRPGFPFPLACGLGLAIALAAGYRHGAFDDFFAGVTLGYVGWAVLWLIFGRQDMPLAWFILVPTLLLPTFLLGIGSFMAGRLAARLAGRPGKGG